MGGGGGGAGGKGVLVMLKRGVGPNSFEAVLMWDSLAILKTQSFLSCLKGEGVQKGFKPDFLILLPPPTLTPVIKITGPLHFLEANFIHFLYKVLGQRSVQK